MTSTLVYTEMLALARGTAVEKEIALTEMFCVAASRRIREAYKELVGEYASLPEQKVCLRVCAAVVQLPWGVELPVTRFVCAD